MIERLKIAEYLARPDAYPVSPQTVRRYVDAGILKGEKVKCGSKVTYYIHIEPSSDDELIMQMARG